MMPMKKILLTTLLTLLSFRGMADGFATIDAGYRYDHIDEFLEFFDTADPTFYLSAGNVYQNIQSFRLGGHGAWRGFCSMPVLFKAGGHYGWVGSGARTVDQTIRAPLKGHTVDATLGIGYLLPFCGVEIAPFIGFGYDDQHFTLKNNTSSLDDPGVSTYNHAKWRSRWVGPWIGADFYFGDAFYCQPMAFNAGYEFHYGWARTNFDPLVNDPANSNFSYQTHLSNVIGHVVHAGLETPIWRCWLAGLDIGYTFWHNMHSQKSRIPPAAESGYTATTFQKNTILSWRSLTVTLNLGLDF
jgi:hypothetical protein